MTPERWAEIEEIFHRAAESEPPCRKAILDDACGNDSELRDHVEALLSSDQTARSKMQAAVRSEFEAVAFSLAGKTVSHYRILSGVGSGGMGLVYSAEDLKLGRRVAIKFLPEESAKDPVALQRFEREARAASALEHPNICPIYEFGEHEGQPFLVMQLLEGQTLREIISSATPGKAPFEIQGLIDVAVQIADGLNAAHTHGIIHRDIKPANIFITNRGEAKILDFGLAKLAEMDAEPITRKERTIGPPGSLFLSRTGLAMGTAAYMSPEQIRGEKLDARTDLFSFGLVMYEMGTGKRAITGETGPEMQDAVLDQIPVAPRALNHEIPQTLERIIQRSIEKEREARYESASEIRAALQKLRRETEFHTLRWWAMAAGIALLAIATFWFAKHQQQSSPHLPDLKLRQLTFNSAEKHVWNGMISPDGNNLLYLDSKGIHIEAIDTGETRNIPQPDALRNQRIELGAWSPDGSRFLINARPAVTDWAVLTDRDFTIWDFSPRDGSAHILRGGAWAWSFSPDGSLIAFGANKGKIGPREIWLMDSSGENARKLFESGDESAIGTVSWSPDGQRITYLRDQGSEITSLSRDLKGNPPTTFEVPLELKGRDINHGLSLPDGRAILSVTEEGTMGNTCNFWIQEKSSNTGKTSARRLTNWTGFCMDPTSVTADGKKLAYLQYSGHPTVYLADLEADETRISNERHFTLNESRDVLADWTVDGKSIIFWSDRNGQVGIYKQRLDGDTAEALVTTRGGLATCCISPDGKWFVFARHPEEDPSASSWQVKRVPINGGAPEDIFSIKNLSGWTCARFPSDVCVIAERSDDRKQAIIHSFDPLRGKGSELTRIPLDPNLSDWSLALSPDGTRLAVIGNADGAVQILSLHGDGKREIRVRGWSNLGEVRWTADGRGLFVTSATLTGGAVLLHVNAQGETQILRQNPGGNYSPGVPSPDGRHLAFVGTADTKNMWMMENF
jgi:eukaryotic-like serine/threonine-protein kinase